MKSFTDCTLCTPGFYCDGSTPASTTGPGTAGWFCEAGSREPDQYAATPGHYTLAGAEAEEKCPAREYNPYYHKTECLDCPAGFYCD